MRLRQNLEVEVKLKVENARRMRQTILLLGFVEKVGRAFEDNWVFDFPSQELRQSGCLLRLREYQGEAMLTLKGPAARSRHFKIREEIESQVSDAKVLIEIFTKLGLKTSFRYQKYRSIFCRSGSSPRSLVLALDETPIGCYLEIEGSPQDIDAVATKLGYSRQDYITDSYWVLFQKQKPRARRLTMVFPSKREISS